MNVFAIASVWHALVARSMADYYQLNEVKFVLEPASVAVYDRVKKIVGEENLVFLGNKVAGFKAGLKVRGYAKNYKNLIGSNIENLYYFCPWSPYQRVLCHSLSTSTKIYRVEDGIRDYLSIEFNPEIKGGWIHRLVKKTLGISDFYLDDFGDFYQEIKYYSFFPALLNTNSYNNQSLLEIKGNLVALIRAMSVNSDSEKFIKSSTRNSCLLIGQSLFEDGSLSIESEVSIYNKYIRQKISENCNIIFKPHPRTDKFKLELLLDANMDYILNGTLFVADNSDMVEQLIVSCKFEEVAGMWSIPILYSSSLFDVDAYSLLSEVVKSDPGSHLSKIHFALSDVFDDHYYKQIKL